MISSTGAAWTNSDSGMIRMSEPLPLSRSLRPPHSDISAPSRNRRIADAVALPTSNTLPRGVM